MRTIFRDIPASGFMQASLAQSSLSKLSALSYLRVFALNCPLALEPKFSPFLVNSGSVRSASAVSAWSPPSPGSILRRGELRVVLEGPALLKCRDVLRALLCGSQQPSALDSVVCPHTISFLRPRKFTAVQLAVPTAPLGLPPAAPTSCHGSETLLASPTPRAMMLLGHVAACLMPHVDYRTVPAFRMSARESAP